MGRFRSRRLGAYAIGAAVACACLLPSGAEAYFGKLAQWGSKGDAPGQFQYANAIASSPDGDVYVADSGDNRIEQFTSGGAFIRQWGQGTPAFSSQPGQFHAPPPLDIAVDQGGNVYVSDPGNNRIQKFTGDGRLIDSTWAMGASGSLATDPAGNVYVSASNVTKYSPDGVLVDTLAISSGTGAIAIDARGDVYVGDAEQRPPGVYEYGPSGKFIKRFGSGGIGGGDADGQFSASGPRAIALAPDGAVWASDGSRIEEFAADGSFISSCGQIPSAPVPATDLAFARNGSLYVAAGFGAFVARYGDVSAPAAACDKTPPHLSAMRLTPVRFRIAATRHSRRGGTLIHYRLSERARIAVWVQRLGSRHKKKLAMTINAKAGRGRLRFTGWLKRRRLTPGHYRVILIASDAARNRSQATSRTCVVVG